ncbi:MAG: hypothetical protein WKF73_20305 [Nocardioidaceae bacterium]
MSGAVPPPQPPSDPNHPLGHSGEGGPTDPTSYTGPASGPGGAGFTGTAPPAGPDQYQPDPDEVGAYPTSGSYPDPNAPQSMQGAGGYDDPAAAGSYAQTTAPSSSSTSVRGDQAKAAMKSANPLDWAIVGAGVLAFLLSLFDGYYTSKFTVDGDDSLFETLPGASDAGSINAWHGFDGPFGWFAALLALAAAVIMVLGLLGVIANKSAVRLGVLAAFGLAALCALLALLVVPGNDADQSSGGITIDIDPGHGVTYWLSLLVILAGAALAAMRRKAND